MPARLRVGDVSVHEILTLSHVNYKKFDNKRKRMKADIIGGKITQRQNLAYNHMTHAWEQTGRESKIVLLVQSDPKSYPKQDTINKHKYPVTFLLKDLSKGMRSPFRWRTGSLKRPKFAKAGMSADKRLQIINGNIKAGIQMEFFFDLEFVLKMFGLLYGVNYAKWAPRKYPNRKTNHQHLIFFDKHALFCVEKILVKMLYTKKGILEDKLFRMRKKK